MGISPSLLDPGHVGRYVEDSTERVGGFVPSRPNSRDGKGITHNAFVLEKWRPGSLLTRCSLHSVPSPANFLVVAIASSFKTPDDDDAVIFIFLGNGSRPF